MTWRWAGALMGLVLLGGACSSGEEVVVAPQADGDVAAPSATETTETASGDTAPAADPAAGIGAGECGAVAGITTFCVEASISGAGGAYTGSFPSVAATATCAEFVAGDEFVPGALTVILVPPDDTPASFDIFIPVYDGPGTYSDDQIDPGLSVSAPPGPGSAAPVILYSLPPGGSVTVTIDSDGGGSIEIAELVDNLTNLAPGSASATWTCTDPA